MGTIQEVAGHLNDFINSNNINVTMKMDGENENQIILTMRHPTLKPPLKITRDGQGIFHLKDTQDGFQRQVYEIGHWNGNQPFTLGEMLTEVKLWLKASH